MHNSMDSNSNGQSSISDSSQVQPTELRAPRSVDTNTNTNTTGNTQNQRPSTSQDSQTQTQTQPQPQPQPQTLTHTRPGTRPWFVNLTEKTSGSDNLVKSAKHLLVMNVGAAVALVISKSQGSWFPPSNPKPPHAKSFDTLVACIAIGFTSNMITILLQEDWPIAGIIGGYAGTLSCVILFLTMAQMLLPQTLVWIVWPAGVFIFLSFLYILTKNRDDTEDENVMFYWGGESVSDNSRVKFRTVEKGTTLRELEALIMPEVPPRPNGENVQLKFKYRMPIWQSERQVTYALVLIDNDNDLAEVWKKKKSPSELVLQFYVYWNESIHMTTPVGGEQSFNQSLQTESPPPPPPSADRVVDTTSSVQ